MRRVDPSASAIARAIKRNSASTTTCSKRQRASSRAGTRALLAKLTDTCLDLWNDRDSGIWELVALEHFTVSKISYWAACDCALELAHKCEIDASNAFRLERDRERIADRIDANCWSPKQNAYTMHPETERFDATFLLATRFGAHRPERFVATRDAIAKELARGPLVYRYSGMEREEGTFIACGFWLADTYALFGGVLRARRANLGLYAEGASCLRRRRSP